MPDIPNNKTPFEQTSLSLLQTFRRIFDYLPSRRKKQFLLLFACLLLSAILETGTLGSIAFFASAMSNPETVMQSSYIIAVREFFQTDFPASQQGLIVSLSILVMFLVVIKNVLLTNVHYWSIRYATFVDSFFGEKLLGGFIRLPYEWHLYRNSADLILAVGWRRYFGMQFMYSLLIILSDGSVTLLMLSTLFIVEPAISLFCLIFLGGAALFIFFKMRSRLDRINQIFRDREESVNRHVTMSLHGVKDVNVFGRGESFIRKYLVDVYELARHESLQRIFTRAPLWILETVGFVVLLSSICIMVFMMESTPAKVTGLVALIAVTAWRVLPAVGRILGGLTSLRTALPFIHKGMQYLREFEVEADNSALVPDKEIPRFSFTNSLKLDRISFAYRGTPTYVLKEIDFVIKKGQTVGIIGTSGAGKSTLVDILLGLLSPTRGRVLIDERELNAGSSAGWKHMIGYVSQSPYIYDGTLAENVAFGLHGSDIKRGRVAECCRMAAMGFVKDLAHGLDTLVGERGVRLSGGQRQRVAIARALYRQPQVIVFDEATSALDSKNENAIQQTIYDLKGELTLIIIAHRLSTVKDCDFLICLDKGRQVNTGPPDVILPWYMNNVDKNVI